MSDTESLLNRWQSAGVLDSETAARIRAFEDQRQNPASTPEQKTPQKFDLAAIGWQGMIALILGAILLACGVVLFVRAHWSELGPIGRFALVMAMVAVFHLAAAFARESFRGLSTALHAVGTIACGAAIALVGQIFNLQEHWPAAVLLWACAAICGWILLRDQAQQTLALLLIPAWIFSELGYRLQGHIGDSIYLGRVLFTWAILYLTFFVRSRRKAVAGILFAAASIAAASGIVTMLSGWTSWSSQQTFVPFSTRFWAWTAIAAIPLIVAAFHGHKGLIPIAVSIAFAIALPWCYHTSTEIVINGPNTFRYTRTEPNLAAHALVAAFAVFLCWWGVRLASRALVNLGMVGFAIAVAWFYFSSIYDALGRSLGLIGLGILFLLGGWALEKMRRRLLRQMKAAESAPAPPAPEASTDGAL